MNCKQSAVSSQQSALSSQWSAVSLFYSKVLQLGWHRLWPWPLATLREWPRCANDTVTVPISTSSSLATGRKLIADN
ncbi:MAG: hypothetical protein F6J94_02225 [Moorea sp. SIO1F2]|uniref:hypothetical protein n=1 Tax=Moorena sp. SIO1F2 TaxID=2607819 RepID=UPI0013BA8ACA|nr:hypothetical protein [Moorena sp. SIO1F2]NET80831.1 hypothetical protein [Moorena sp. SIO1F2]